MNLKVSHSNAGMGLIEVLVALGLVSMIAMAMASMFSSQQKSIRYFSQKQEMIDLKAIMQQQLAKINVCTWQVKDKVIDVSMATSESSPSPTVIALKDDAIYQGIDDTSAVIAKAGQRLPTSLNGIFVASVSFKNIYATGNPNEYKGVFDVSFDASSLVFAAKPVQVQQIIKTTAADPLNAKRIDSCLGSPGVSKILEGTMLSTDLDWICPGVIPIQGVCTNSWRKNVVFSEAFNSPPRVLIGILKVTGSGAPCAGGATDTVGTAVANVTTTGFTFYGGGSPVAASCGIANEGDTTLGDFSWTAIGN